MKEDVVEFITSGPSPCYS